MKHLEIKTIEHKGISITYKVNYDNNNVTVCEGQIQNFGLKNFSFVNIRPEQSTEVKDRLDTIQLAIESGIEDLHVAKMAKETIKKLKIEEIEEKNVHTAKAVQLPKPKKSKNSRVQV